jgi:hypothetical protein
LETQIQQMSLDAGTAADDVFKAAGQRLLSSMQGIRQHAETAVNRLGIFLGLKKAATGVSVGFAHGALDDVFLLFVEGIG